MSLEVEKRVRTTLARAFLLNTSLFSASLRRWPGYAEKNETVVASSLRVKPEHSEGIESW